MNYDSVPIVDLIPVTGFGAFYNNRRLFLGVELTGGPIEVIMVVDPKQLFLVC